MRCGGARCWLRRVAFCWALASSSVLVAGGHGHHHAKKAGTAGAVASARHRRGLKSFGFGYTGQIGTFEPFVPAWPNLTKYDAVDHSHNWCPVKEAILAGKLRFQDALRGRDVSMLFALQDTPVSIDFNTTSRKVIGGMPVEVFAEIARRAGFRWRNSTGVAHYIDRASNETDEGWLLWASEKFDVVDWFTITPLRMRKGLKFAYPFINISPHLVGKMDVKTDTIWERFLQCFAPFSASLWAFILVGFLFSAAVYMCIEGGRDDIPQKTAAGGLGQAFFLTICQFTGGGGFAPQSPAGKLFVMSVSFLMMLIVTAYTANLAGEMIMAKVAEAPVTSVEDAMTRDQAICVRRGSPFFRLLQRHFPDARLALVNSESEKFPAISQGKCVAAVVGELWWEFERRISRFNPKCELYAIGRNLMELHGSFVSRATSATCKEVVVDVMTFTMHQMYLDGFMQEARDADIEKLQDVFCPAHPTAQTTDDTMRPRHMAGIFLVHLVIAVACVAISVYNGHCGLPGSYVSFSNEEEDGKDVSSSE
mmetsp:Transcript_11982/g.33843  ORF Transcript_11982/g.33843 Transcript_11982/m.33843 type:complete len:536 (-) Transcript_11982:156-1763(-)